MNFYYISPSIIPSNSANSIHAMMQATALSQAGIDVTIFSQRSIRDQEKFCLGLQSHYGIDPSSLKIVSFYSKYNFATNLKIALLSFIYFLKNNAPEIILSRNLYASFIFSILLRQPIFFETHQLEFGFRKILQKAIVSSPKVITIVISEKLSFFLKEHLKINYFKELVLHDAAPEGIEPISEKEKKSYLHSKFPITKQGWHAICGYFGALLPGRGVEIIEKMAKQRPNVLFLVFGGTNEEIANRNKSLPITNIIFSSYLPYPLARKAIQSVDILLMPYQEILTVGIDGQGSNTSKWMSPMKMFDYLASGVPFISSNLPVLREVLTHEENCLLVEPSDINSWLKALDKLMHNPILSLQIASKAHLDYKRKHTWHKRGQKILKKEKEM